VAGAPLVLAGILLLAAPSTGIGSGTRFEVGWPLLVIGLGVERGRRVRHARGPEFGDCWPSGRLHTAAATDPRGAGT
jgi:hypothetical protein